MRKHTFASALAFTGALVLSTGAMAADKLTVTRSVHINAPPAKVWGIVHNFSDLTWVHIVKSSEATDGNHPGSVRSLHLGGPILHERLVRYNNAKEMYTYRITKDPANKKIVPVSHYISTISVKPSGSGSVATWTGTFERADLSANPPADQNDAAAKKSVAGIYEMGLADLKKKAEGM